MPTKKDIVKKANRANTAALSFEQLQDAILELRGQQVLLDCDVAKLYGVETKRVNEAVKNNPDKFPFGYVFRIERQEVINLRSKFSTANWGGTRTLPTAFTEKGLYMLANILKSPQATQATLNIIETFAQLRELARTMQAATSAETEQEKKSLMQRSGELIGDVIGSQLETTSTETEIELNFAMVKIRRKVTRAKK